MEWMLVGEGKLRMAPGCQLASLMVDGGMVSGCCCGNHGSGHRGCPSTPSPGAALGPLGMAVLTGRAMRRKGREAEPPSNCCEQEAGKQRVQGGRS